MICININKNFRNQRDNNFQSPINKFNLFLKSKIREFLKYYIIILLTLFNIKCNTNNISTTSTTSTSQNQPASNKTDNNTHNNKKKKQKIIFSIKLNKENDPKLDFTEDEKQIEHKGKSIYLKPNKLIAIDKILNSVLKLPEDEDKKKSFQDNIKSLKLYFNKKLKSAHDWFIKTKSSKINTDTISEYIKKIKLPKPKKLTISGIKYHIKKHIHKYLFLISATIYLILFAASSVFTGPIAIIMIIIAALCSYSEELTYLYKEARKKIVFNKILSANDDYKNHFINNNKQIKEKNVTNNDKPSVQSINSTGRRNYSLNKNEEDKEIDYKKELFLIMLETYIDAIIINKNGIAEKIEKDADLEKNFESTIKNLSVNLGCPEKPTELLKINSNNFKKKYIIYFFCKHFNEILSNLSHKNPKGFINETNENKDLKKKIEIKMKYAKNRKLAEIKDYICNYVEVLPEATQEFILTLNYFDKQTTAKVTKKIFQSIVNKIKQLKYWVLHEKVDLEKTRMFIELNSSSIGSSITFIIRQILKLAAPVLAGIFLQTTSAYKLSQIASNVAHDMKYIS